MRSSHLIATIVLTTVLSSVATAALTAPKTPTTRIETDQKTGEIHFFVNNQDVARLDAKGMHIRSTLYFGGILSNVGEDHYAD